MMFVLLLLAPFQASLDDLPPEDDLYRLPPPAVANEQVKLGADYSRYLANIKVEEARHVEWQAACAEMGKAYAAWSHLANAHINTGESRRRWLKLVRNWLGPEAYYHGHFPPAVSVRRFVATPDKEEK